MGGCVNDTINPEEAAGQRWDVIVVGAGLAGIAIAGGIADLGATVLLVDRGRFPRHKTCGGTLNARAVGSLRRLGFEKVLLDLGPTAVGGVEWRSGGRGRAFLPMPSGALAVSRSALDAAMLREVVRRGVKFVGGVRCVASDVADDARRVELRRGEEKFVAEARMVVAADGLGSTLSQAAGLALAPARRPSSYMGCSVIVERDAVLNAPRDRITMALGPAGYTGIVRVENGRWNIAAAIRLDAVKRGGSPHALALENLRRAGLSVGDPEGAPWCVTQPDLHRAVRRPWGERLLVVGDAAGYVEPITGEGMAWALSGAEGVIAALASGWSGELGPRWEAAWNERVGARRGLVRLAGFLARRPQLARVAILAMSIFPTVGRRVVGSLSQEVTA